MGKDYTTESKSRKRGSRSEIKEFRHDDKPRNRRSSFEDVEMAAPRKSKKSKERKGKGEKKHHGNFDAFTKKNKQ